MRIGKNYEELSMRWTLFVLSLIVFSMVSFLQAHEGHTHPAKQVGQTLPELAYDKPKKGEKFDHVIKMSVKPGLKFSLEKFTVKPGSRVKIIFKNNDHEMSHNIIICKPGKNVTKEVGEAALQLADKGIAMHYVPKHKSILYSWVMVEAGKTKEFAFTAPKKKGVYPYVCTLPGHYTLMKGVMHVGALRPVKPPVKRKVNPRLQFQLNPENKTIVYRTALNKYKVPSSVTVGSPTGVHYAFDTKACVLALAWKGAYLNTAGDWNGRGGGGSSVSGKVFYKTVGAHFSIDNAKTAGKVQFKAYRLNKKRVPTFFYTVDGLPVAHEFFTENNQLKERITVQTDGEIVHYYDRNGEAIGKRTKNKKKQTIIEVTYK
jgi:plastocyanin